ncbi:heterodisulfide reductase-related iron-sulfur binding cluster [Chloroflexota bacterium]
MVPGRESLWNIQFSVIFYILAAVAVVILVYAIYRHYRRWRLGGPANRFNHLGRRIWDFIVITVVDGIIHRKFFGVTVGLGHRHLSLADLKPKEFYPGLIHFLLFTGAIILLLGTILEFVSHYIYEFNQGSFYLGYSLITDIGGIMAIVGAILAIARRYVQKPDRLDNKWDDLVALLLILFLVITGFIVEGLRIAASELQAADWTPWSPGGYVLALAFSGFSEGALRGWHAGIWWFHSILALGAIVYVSLFNSQLFHIIWDPINVFFRNLEPRGALAPIDFENTDLFGVSKIEEFTWKQLLDLDACTRCGRCQDACPAYFSGKALNPKQVILNLKEHLYEVCPLPLSTEPIESRKDMISEVITDEALWDCTTCRACQQACPVYIEHIDKIIDMRRNLVMERGQFPESVRDALKSLGARGHPWRGTTATRTTWFDSLELQVLAEHSDSDMLYWVGCTAALDDRNMSVSRAIVKILQSAGVNFGVLGAEENCCGDPARRMGDEYLFKTICENNVEILKSYNVKKILTTCPHCFNILMQEYPQFGGNFEVIHHTQLIADLIRNEKLKFGEANGGKKAAYHDSCYLGRYNDIYQEPREILRAVGRLQAVELPRNMTRSFCCGGGGGHMWMEEDSTKRFNERRIDEVIQAKVDVVATACPYCLTMFEDGVKAKGEEETLQAKDLSELVAEALDKAE